MLADTHKLLWEAQRGRYAVGHFNINNMEIVQGVVHAAQRMKSPVILATSEGALNYAGMKYLYALARVASENARVPVALHLDHGRDVSIIKEAIRVGYSSVMIDASHESFERNVLITRRVVGWARRKHISVEAELGTIGGVEDTVRSRNILYTDPIKAKEFVERTGCDSLAVAIGTSHGAYKFEGRAKLHQQLLEEIRQKVKIPLVLHGASGVPLALITQAEKYGAKLTGVQGVPDVEIRSAIRRGICKINTDTDIRVAFDAAVRKVISTQPQDFDPRHILGPAREIIQRVVEQRMKLFGSVGKA